MTTLKDKDGNALVPGALYAMFELRTDARGEQYAADGEIVWFGGDGHFYGYDDDEPTNADYDYLVRQPGYANPEYAVLEPLPTFPARAA